MTYAQARDYQIAQAQEWLAGAMAGQSEMAQALYAAGANIEAAQEWHERAADEEASGWPGTLPLPPEAAAK